MFPIHRDEICPSHRRHSRLVLLMVRAGAKASDDPVLAPARLSKVSEAIADLAPPHALLNEVGQQQRQPDTKHNHDHRRIAVPQA
jgi:hypothetical protein